VVDLLRTLSPCAALRFLSFTDCSCDKTGEIASWGALQMPHITRLTITMRKPHVRSLLEATNPSAQSLTRSTLFHAQSTPLPLHTLLGAFPSLRDLDISNVLNPKATLFSPLDTLAGVPAEILMLLKFAREQASIQRLVIRFPQKNEILRCWRVGDDEAEKGSYGFARELWRGW